MYAVVCKEMAVFRYSLHPCKFEINNVKESKKILIMYVISALYPSSLYT